MRLWPGVDVRVKSIVRMAACLFAVLLFESPGVLAGQRNITNEQPVLELGPEGSDEFIFQRVAHAFRARDGSVVVVDGGVLDVRVFSSNGQFVRRIGRRGSGPGEFRSVWLARESGDSTLYIYDGQLFRMSVINWVTGEVKSAQLEGDAKTRWPSPVGVIEDSLWVFTNGVSFEKGELGRGVIRPPFEILLFGLDGRKRQAPFAVPGSEFWVPAPGSNALATEILPFGDITLVTAIGQRIGVTHTRQAATELFDKTGRRVSAVDYDTTARSITRADLDHYVDATVRVGRGRIDAAQVRDKLRIMRLPRQLPVTDRFHLAADGYNYLRLNSYPPGVSSRLWIGLAQGKPPVKVLMSSRFVPTQMTAAWIVGIWRGEDDVESIRVFRGTGSEQSP